MQRQVTTARIKLLASAATTALAPLLCAAAASAGVNDFTQIILPDTQYYSQSDPATFNAQTQWIVDNKAAMNIAFVHHVGDIVNHGWDLTQWSRAVTAMNKLNGVVPYGVSAGNHDHKDGNVPETFTSVEYVPRFGPSRYSGQPWAAGWYGGASPSGFSSYQTFTAAGRTYLNLTMDCNATTNELN